MRDSTIHRRRELYEEAMEIVELEYQQDLSLDGIARRLASSRRQLQRAFAEAGETTFRSRLQRVRMMRAAELLQDRSLPVNRVATAVGYRQPAQFAKAFRRHHGRPPSDFRADPGRLAA
jgi:transcriptional regulator GlxA family with amidase domain